METIALNQASAYARPETFFEGTVRKASRDDSKTTVSTDYKVSISAEGQSRSLADINGSQNTDKAEFLRAQKNDKAANDRDLENQRQTFERKQASEKQQFEIKQSMDKIKSMQQVRNYSS